jgi:hypothetical protein
MIDLHVVHDFDWSILDYQTRKQIQEGSDAFWADCELAVVNGEVVRTDIPRKKPITGFDFVFNDETQSEEY